MKYECISCHKIYPFRYSDAKYYLKRYGRSYFNGFIYSSANIKFTCNECNYKNKLVMLPPIYRETKDLYDFDKKIDGDYTSSRYLFGVPGSGKTFMATMILKHLWKNNQKGYFLSYPEFIFSIQVDYEAKANLVVEMKEYQGCLVIDDFGAEKMTDFVRQVSYLIINYREQHQLQTIITSNFTLDEIDQYIDRRISSRLSGWCKVSSLNGDKRLNKK